MDLFAYADTRNELDSTETRPLEIEGEAFILDLLRRGEIEPGNRFHCKTESHILQLAYAYNKILSLSNSRTRILAHQVESTHRIVNALNQRFLIADEVGLGKTIEAGLVIKELIYRYDYRRILIACPASLIYQWQSEMKSKFNEHFEIMDRRLLNRARRMAGEGGNPWNVYDRIICSLDFIKSDSMQKDLEATRWDAVIFDEAHRLRRDANNSTLAYTMAETVSERTNALLLLSATPFRGKLEELYFLIALLDKNVLGPFQSFSQEYCYENADTSALKDKLSEVLIRRTKRDVGGFTKRYAKTIKFDLYPDERYLYDETTKYVVEEFNRALQTENRAVGFVMTVFQKLLDSSSFALLSALRNRMGRLHDLVERVESGSLVPADFPGRFDLDDMDDDSDDGMLDMHLEKTVEELKLEISTISRIIDIAEKIEVNKKGEKLVELIDSLKKKGRKKFLIFTQFRTTQDYLVEILKEYKTVVFNGSMNGDEKEQAIMDFKGDAEVLIATEAGGEGRNMQFCSILINYDLPWSPLKIEQRIGRIHRFGQARDVLIYNFSTSDTVAERILEVLTHKLKLFEESIGPPDVMLGQIEDELKLNSLFMELAAGNKKKKELDNEIEQRMNVARENYEKLSELTVAGRMDFNYDEYYRITLKERQFSNNRIERLVNLMQEEDSYCDSFISRRHPVNNLYPVRCCDENIRGKYGTFDSQVALDNDNLEFLAFGHPIVDRIIRYCQSSDFGGYTGIKTVKYDKPCVAMLCNYVVTCRSVHETRELMTVLVPCCGDLDDFELEDLEREVVEAEPFSSRQNASHERVLASALTEIDSLAERARLRLADKIRRRIADMGDDLDFHIDPQLEKIRDSYDRSIKELEEKLELQQSRMKWYGKDMKGVITRTSNKILKLRREKEKSLETYRGYLGIEYSVKMINAGFIISV